MAGEEQAEIVGSARDVFRTECVLDVAAVTRITALSDLTHDLVTEKPSEAEAEKDKRKLDEFTVLTNLQLYARNTNVWPPGVASVPPESRRQGASKASGRCGGNKEALARSYYGSSSVFHRFFHRFL